MAMTHADALVDERSLTGAVARVPDADSMVGELVARVSGFGALRPCLDDPAAEEIWTTTRAGSSWRATGGTS
jgi:hypothetical protein